MKICGRHRILSIFIILQIVLSFSIAPAVVNGTGQGDLAYLDFGRDIIISKGSSGDNTTHIYDINERFAVDLSGNGLGRIASLDGNNVLEMAAPSATEISSSSASVYFAGLPKNSKYRVVWNFMRKSGSRMDITLENGTWDSENSNNVRVGFIRFKEDNTMVIQANWAGVNKEGSGTCTPDVWHSLEGEFDPVNKKAVWYLDGKKVGEYTYQASGNIAVAIFQAVAPDEDAVTNKETVFMIDDIESQSGSISSGVFGAVAVADSEKVTLRLTEPAWSYTELDSVKLVSGEATYTSTAVEKCGKRYEFSFDEGVLKPGKAYTLKIEDTIRSAFKYTKTLTTSSLEFGIVPDSLEVSVTPLEVGGIYTDSDEVKFEVTIKNTKASAVSADGVLTVIDSNENTVASEGLGTIQLEANETKKITVAPEITRYGSFNLDIGFKPEGDETSIKATLPFSKILSNGVQNPKMGVSTHYVDQYRTPLGDFGKEIQLNKKAGFGIVRDDFQWNIYEAEQGVYQLSDRQKKLFETLEENNLTPYPVLGNGTWTYGEHWSYPCGPEQLEKYETYIRKAVRELDGYVPVYEMGNEWNSNHPGAPVQDYVNMMQAAYTGIKATDKSLKAVGFVVGVSDESIEFLEECLQLGAAQYCDAVSIHPYSVLQSPEEFDVQSRIAEVSSLLAEYGAEDKEIIVSEWGWSSCAPNDCTEELQAKYAVRGAGLVGGMVDAIIWYEGQERYNQEIIEENFGLLRRRLGDTPYSAKPIYVALSCLNSLTGDKEQQEAQKDQNGTYTCIYENANQITIQFWNPSADAALQLDAIGGYDDAAVYDMYGNHNNITAENGKYSLTATDMPAYLVLTKTLPNPELPGNELPEPDKSSIVCDYNFDNSVDFDLFTNGGERIDLQDGVHRGVIKFYAQKSVGEAGISQVGAIAANSPDSTKKFVISFDFKALQTDVGYVFRSYRLDSKPFMFFKVGTNGKAGFLNNGGWTTSEPNEENGDWAATAYNADVWNSVDILVDPEENLFRYFINSVCIGESSPSNALSASKPFGWMDIYSGLATDLQTNGLLWDNFKISYVDETPFCAVASKDGNTIRVEFSEAPDITAGDAVKLLCTKTGKLKGSVMFDERGLIIKAPMLSDNQCTLIFSDSAKSVTGKAVSNRFITLFRGGVPDSYIGIAKMRDLSGKKYLPFDEISVVQDCIEITTAGKTVDFSLADITFADETGKTCSLGTPELSEDGIKIPVNGILDTGKEYTLTVNGLTADGAALPVYKARFTTNNKGAEAGFAQTDIVAADGSAVQTLMAGSRAFVSTRYLNADNSDKKAVVAIAAYSKLSDNSLKLLDISSANIDLGLSKITVIGPDNEEVAITIPEGTSVLKGFVWDAENCAPMINSVVKQ